MNDSVISALRHDSDGRVVSNNSEDSTSSEGVTYTSESSYFSVCFSIQYSFGFAFLPKFFKLSELVLTIPATSAADESSFSALKRLKNYLRNSKS
jgi:hypothetical protein